MKTLITLAAAALTASGAFAATPAPLAKPAATATATATAGKTATATLKNGKKVTYDCTKKGNLNKKACKG